MEDALPHNYGHGQRAFLQALLGRGTMTFEEAQPIIAAIETADRGDDAEIRPEQITEDDFHSYLDAATRAASLYDYEVRNTLHQTTKQRIYAIVNTTSDPQTQLATTFGADELSFIKRVFDAMFEKYNTPRMEIMALTGMQAMKVARPQRRPSQANGEDEQTQSSQGATDKGLKHSEAEAVLANLIDGGWLEKSKDGFHSLSPRALLELRPWLLETYNDPDAEADEWQRIKTCEACKDLLTVGLRCADPACTLRLHDICQEAFWRARRGETCPKCSQPWTGKHYVGERAVTKTDAYRKSFGRSGGGGGGRRSTLADDVIRQEGGEEEDEEEDGEGP